MVQNTNDLNVVFINLNLNIKKGRKYDNTNNGIYLHVHNCSYF